MNKAYRIIKEDEDACILYIPGNNGNVDMGNILLYNGGYICPKHNDLSQHTSLFTHPVGNDDGDIVFILCNALIGHETYCDYIELATDTLNDWGIMYE